MTFVIMAGGKGERLWPLVRSTMPKVCLSPDGTRNLLQATVDRLGPAWPGASWLIVTTKDQAAAVRRSLSPALRRQVLVEPGIKNTAACITLAAVALATRDPGRVMVVVPADHWIGDVEAYRRAVRTAIEASVARDALVTIGIRPTHAHPGLGYLCAGSPLPTPRERANGAGFARMFRLDRFIEKPSVANAKRLIRRKKTYWNSGTFVGTADKFLECITEWLPDHVKRLMPLARDLGRERNGWHGPGTAPFTLRAQTAYRTLEAVSFDHGVMDHLHEAVVVEGDFAWADLGSWDAWAKLGRSICRVVDVGSRNTTVISQEPHLVAMVGVSDLLVVHTPTATLICHRDNAQAVREAVARLDGDATLASYR